MQQFSRRRSLPSPPDWSQAIHQRVDLMRRRHSRAGLGDGIAVAVIFPPRMDRRRLIDGADRMAHVAGYRHRQWPRYLAGDVALRRSVYTIAFPLKLRLPACPSQRHGGMQPRRRLACALRRFVGCCRVIPGAGSGLYKHFIPETMLCGAANRTRTKNVLNYLRHQGLRRPQGHGCARPSCPDASHPCRDCFAAGHRGAAATRIVRSGKRGARASARPLALHRLNYRSAQTLCAALGLPPKAAARPPQSG